MVIFFLLSGIDWVETKVGWIRGKNVEATEKGNLHSIQRVLRSFCRIVMHLRNQDRFIDVQMATWLKCMGCVREKRNEKIQAYFITYEVIEIINN